MESLITLHTGMSQNPFDVRVGLFYDKAQILLGDPTPPRMGQPRNRNGRQAVHSHVLPSENDIS